MIQLFENIKNGIFDFLEDEVVSQLFADFIVYIFFG